jgi:hypothetical protein
MANASVSIAANLAGTTTPVVVNLSDDGVGQWTPSVPAGHVPSGWTMTDASDGVAAMADGFGLASGDKIDVFWSGGRHYGMTATVTGSNVALAGGAGDDLPASGTAVVLAQRLSVEAVFTPADMDMLLVASDQPVSVVFEDADGTVLCALTIPAGGCCLWWTNSGIGCPMSGGPTATIQIGNGSTTAANVTIAVLYDATPG